MECKFSDIGEKCLCEKENEKVCLRGKYVPNQYGTIGTHEERQLEWRNFLKKQDFLKSGEQYPNVKVGERKYDNRGQNKLTRIFLWKFENSE